MNPWPMVLAALALLVAAAPVTAIQVLPADEPALQPALLTLEDLPPGWLLSFPGEQGSYTTTRCGQDLTARYPSAARQFKRSELGPVLLHELVTVPDGSGVAIMASVRERLAECPDWVTTQSGRPTLRWSAIEVAFPSLAEDALAIRAMAPFPFLGRATGDQAFLRLGNIFVIVGYASVGAHEDDALERYAALAMNKLRSAGVPAARD